MPDLRHGNTAESEKEFPSNGPFVVNGDVINKEEGTKDDKDIFRVDKDSDRDKDKDKTLDITNEDAFRKGQSRTIGAVGKDNGKPAEECKRNDRNIIKPSDDDKPSDKDKPFSKDESVNEDKPVSEDKPLSNDKPVNEDNPVNKVFNKDESANGVIKEDKSVDAVGDEPGSRPRSLIDRVNFGWANRKKARDEGSTTSINEKTKESEAGATSTNQKASSAASAEARAGEGIQRESASGVENTGETTPGRRAEVSTNQKAAFCGPATGGRKDGEEKEEEVERKEEKFEKEEKSFIGNENKIDSGCSIDLELKQLNQQQQKNSKNQK